MASQSALSASRIRALKPSAHRREILDADGLYLEIWPSGRMVWRFRYAIGKMRRRINLGRMPDMTLAHARTERDRVASGLANGNSPAQLLHRRTRSKSVTLREFSERYMAEVVAKVRKSPRAILRYLERDIYPSLGEKNLTAVNAADVRELVFARRDAGRPMAAIALRGLLKRIFDYAIICQVATVNPTQATPNKFIARVRSRERALNEAEIGLFLRKLRNANENEDMKVALELILMTLARKSELRLARWQHIDFDRGEWEIPPELSKTGKGQIIYLSDQAKALFRKLEPGAGLLFPHRASPTQPMAAHTLNSVLARASKGMAHFTVHDLRRTAATRLTEMGFEPDVIEKAMNHTIKGVRGVYNRAQYADQRKQMLQAWADHLDYLGRFGDLLNI
jgi:integrase